MKLNKIDKIKVTLNELRTLRGDLNDSIEKLDLKEANGLLDDLNSLERVKLILLNNYCDDHEQINTTDDEINSLITLYEKEYNDSISDEAHELFHKWGVTCDVIEILEDRLKVL